MKFHLTLNRLQRNKLLLLLLFHFVTKIFCNQNIAADLSGKYIKMA